MEKGYLFTKMGDPISIKVEDMSHGSQEKIDVKCDICGKEYTSNIATLYKKDREDGLDYCSLCKVIKIRKTFMEKYGVTDPMYLPGRIEKMRKSRILPYSKVKAEFEKVGYVLVSKKYTKESDKLEYLCPVHGKQKIRYDVFRSGGRCAKCHSYHNENKIREILESYNVIFSEQYTFSDLKIKRFLKFDFCVFENDGKTIKFLLEYQGEQHYMPINFSGKGLEFSKKKLTKVKYSDRLKRLYCKSHGIPLVAIKYTQKNNLESIISNLLKLRW